MMQQRILVTGPTRSGKSEWAEALAMQSELPVVYVATSCGDADDPEWQARITTHRQRRPNHWRTLEVSADLTAALNAAPTTECWLVDSLGTWLANGLEQSETDWQETMELLATAVSHFSGTLILVAEETGWGVVPAYPLGRKFRDRLGSLTRHLGTLCDQVYLVVAGYAVDLRRTGMPVPNHSTPLKLQNITTD